MNKIKNLLDTMELIHYIEKFKNKIFVLVVTGSVEIRDIIPDIIILQSFNIKIALVMGYSEETYTRDVKSITEDAANTILEVSGILKRNNLDPMPSLGTEVFAKKIKNSDFGKVMDFDIETIDFALKHNKIPIIAPLGLDNRGRYYKLDEKEIALNLAIKLKASKIFLISEEEDIRIQDKKYSFLSYAQVKDILSKDPEMDKKVKAILQYSKEVLDAGIKEFAVMKGDTGNIYTEVLTYDISGTLISRADDELIRKADIEDISPIYLLMKNEMERNNILPVTEDDIEDELDNYIVYDIEGSIVGVGKLTHYDKVGEIAKIATLPRYQGGQKAKEICKDLVEKAIYEGMDYVFGLTINPIMMRLFLSIGFVEVDRNTLPDKWKEHYDFTRPSKAFKMDLANQ